ncbi:hypothetical protein O7606_14575 [Micromonospora sp. WMMD882]|uniref:hypothetical protein n=1 Tax=Micromonospora sp. WMMD882 TaxID=3015151 RepID=UPI00248C0E33|nr:hypothetical protein [Micromonospora sp. WMMD882]WBB77511.1 hypothetical protein O7606_14575 [Micromonospora sp. WMMD882]
MRRSTTRIAAGAAAALIATLTMTAPGSPAAADDLPSPWPPDGLTFTANYPHRIVGQQAVPDDVCRPVPAEATFVHAWTNGFTIVEGYREADCQGEWELLNNFHSWHEGEYVSYRAPVYVPPN